MAHTLDIRETERELQDLRVEEWSDLGLAALAIVISLVATAVAPSLALPLFLGGVVVAVFAGRAFFRRWDLCDRLLLDPGAYEIAEIHARAAELAGLESRKVLARSLRALLAPSPVFRRPQVQAFATELAALADMLEDPRLELDPHCAVRCKRLVSDPVESPLLSSLVPADGLRVAIMRIRAGFEPRS